MNIFKKLFINNRKKYNNDKLNNNDIENILYIVENSTNINFIAVFKDGLTLQFVKEQTPEICLVAVNQNPWSLNYIKEFCTRNLFSGY